MYDVLWNATLLDADWGRALAPATEGPAGVFERRYEKGVVRLDCNAVARGEGVRL